MPGEHGCQRPHRDCVQPCVDDDVHCQSGLREPGEADSGSLIMEQNRTDPARQCLIKIVFGDDETPRVPVSLVRIALQRFWN